MPAHCAVRLLTSLHHLFLPPCRALRYRLLQQKKPTVAYLIQLERFLQTGQFKAFWAQRLAPEVEDAREMLDRVAGFDDHVRRCTLHWGCKRGWVVWLHCCGVWHVVVGCRRMRALA